jgi:cytochrome c oxidase cbb3-type subunit 3
MTTVHSDHSAASRAARVDRDEEPRILDHDYDEIREYDNPTPGWWSWLFAGTMAFAIGYLVLSVGSAVDDGWKKAQLAEFKRVFGRLGQLNPDEATVASMMDSPEMMRVAGGIFAGNCATCHARDGGGGIGPNMADDVYKNITRLVDFYTVITKGTGNGAMPAWENRLSTNERIVLAAYAASLRGTTPASAKQPEGTSKPLPWPKANGSMTTNDGK